MSNTFKCDICGKFIAYKELMKDGGASQSFIPETNYTRERIEHRCKRCTDKHGMIKLINEYYSGLIHSWIN